MKLISLLLCLWTMVVFAVGGMWFLTSNAFFVFLAAWAFVCCAGFITGWIAAVVNKGGKV